MAQQTVGCAAPGLVILCCIGKQVQQAMENIPISRSHDFFISYFRIPCSRFLPWLAFIDNWKLKLILSSPYWSHGVCHSNRKLDGIFLEEVFSYFLTESHILSVHVLNNVYSSLGRHTINCNSKKNIKLFTIDLLHCGFSNNKYILQCKVYMGLFGETKAGEVTGTTGEMYYRLPLFVCIVVKWT